MRHLVVIAQQYYTKPTYANYFNSLICGELLESVEDSTTKEIAFREGSQN